MGKTTVSANLAVSIAAQGRDVMLVDADLGLANVDVVLGLHTRFHLGHVIAGRMCAGGRHRHRSAWPANRAGRVRHQTHGDPVARPSTPASSARSATCITGSRCWSSIPRPGLHDSVTTFSQAAHHVVVVVCDEPASITDAYALIKVLSREHGVQRFQILANQTRRSGEGPGACSRKFSGSVTDFSM